MEKQIDRQKDIIVPLSETLHIEVSRAEEMLNSLNKEKGLDDIEALSFILQHFELCLTETLSSTGVVSNYDRLSGKNLKWAVEQMSKNERLPIGIQKMCELEVTRFIKDFMRPTIWEVFYRDRYDALPTAQ